MTKLSYPIGFFLKHAEPFLKKYSFSTAYEKYDEVLLLNDYCKLKVVLDKVSVDLYILDPTERYRFVALHVAALLLDPDEYTRTLESCGLKNILYPWIIRSPLCQVFRPYSATRFGDIVPAV